jgi:glycosyltransferase involved in cell wall biosynthesis
VVCLGIDPEKYYPDPAQADYVYETIGIPRDRRIFFYAGHMEQRKGVHVLVKAARILVDRYQRRDFHLLVLGNKNGEEQCFIPLMEGSRVAEHVTFGGYRNDIDRLLRGCYVGLIGSSGWDSFTLTGVEMAASGLPLVVSDLAGLNEAVDAGSTGFTFPPSNAEALAERMIYMLDQPVVRDAMGRKARERVLSGFTRDHQLEQLVAVVHRVTM